MQALKILFKVRNLRVVCIFLLSFSAKKRYSENNLRIYSSEDKIPFSE
jgi:hypothetical protein